MLLVAPDFPPKIVGGGATVVQRLAEEYTRRGYRVHVVALDVTRGGLLAAPETADRDGYRVTFLPLALRWTRKGIVYNNAFPPSLPSVRWLRRLLREERWDGVHLHGIPVSLVDLLAFEARSLGIPYVLTVHGVIADHRRYGPLLGRAYLAFLRIENWLYRRSAAITAVSAATLAEVRREGFSAGELRVVRVTPHPPEPEPAPEEVARLLERWGLSEGRFAVSIGNFLPRKGHETLTGAVARLERAGSLPEGFRFVLVGRDVGGGHLDRLLASLRANDLGERVRVLPGVTEVEKEVLLRHAAFTLCTSLYEASPMVVFEALTRGCALVASDIPPIREILGAAEHPCLFAAGDPAALASALEGLFRQPERIRELRAESAELRRAVPSWGEIAEEYLAIFSAAAGDRSPGPAR